MVPWWRASLEQLLRLTFKENKFVFQTKLSLRWIGPYTYSLFYRDYCVDLHIFQTYL